jgi:uncharacterized protein YodC (DUF2158 family)
MNEKTFACGDLVKHKTNNMLLIVISKSSDYYDSFQCRYFNAITGIFCTQLFKKQELKKDNE